MKKIAFFNYFMGFGGTEKVLVNLLSSLDYTKVSVDLFLEKKQGEFLEQIPKDVRVFELPDKIITSSQTIIKHYFCDFRLFSILAVLLNKCLLKIVKLVRLNECEIYLYKLLMKKWGKYNYRYCANLKSHYDKVIAFQGGDPFLQFWAGYAFQANQRIMWVHGNIGDNQEQLLMDSFDKIVCVSQSTKKWFCETYPKNIKKTNVIYNLLNISEIKDKSSATAYDMATGEHIIVSVGRLSLEKGFQLIPQIAKKLINDGLNFEWYIIGDGDLYKDIENEIVNSGIPFVHLLGGKSNPYPYMKNCTLYVQPSFTEGYCTTTNEAKVLGKPILVTDVPGMREQFNHQIDGYIVPNTTVDDIAKGIYYLFNHKEEMHLYERNLENYYLYCNKSIADIEKLLYC